jgi:hemoglobin/transferrin/lactoferrin receptor protein
MKRLLTLLVYSVFASLMSVMAATAETDGKIKGTVKDSEEAAVSGVEVSLLLANQAIARTTLTDSSGNFVFEKIPAGTYGIHIDHTGFLRHRSAVQVTSGATRELSIVLEVNPIMENVTVTAEPGVVTDTRKVDTQVNLIPQQEIFERAPEVVAQVVDEEPGVNLQRTSPSLSAVFVRGLTGRNVAVFVDGVRYTTSAQRGGVGTFFSLIEPSTLETVEILRGPNSSQYGSDVHGGVVNFISQAPRYGDLDSEFHGKGNIFYTSPTNGFGGNALFTYGTRRYGLLLNMNGRRISTLRPGGGLDHHAAVTRFLGLPSDIFGTRLPDTGFTQYGTLVRANFNLDDNTQFLVSYARNQQDNGKRYDQLLGGDGNNIADLRNLMTDTFYVRLFRQKLGFFDNGSFTFSYNGQREERINQGGQGNPAGAITNQRERTNVLGFNFYLDKQISRNNFLFGADVYRDKIKAPAFTTDPVTHAVVNSRPRIPNGARYLSYGFYAQDNVTAIPDRLQINAAVRYSVASYVSRAPNSALGPNGLPLFPDDSARFDAFSTRIGAVVNVAGGFDVAGKFTRGFRAPNTTDLGIIGLVGTGFEVDAATAAARNGFIGTTAGGDAVSTGIPVTRLGPEFSDSFDLSFRYTSRRFGAELTGFTTKLSDVYFDQALVLPAGATGTFLGSDQIIAQNAAGLVFVAAAPTSPVLVRVNFDDARLNGVEANARARFSDQFSGTGNFTYIRAHSLLNGLPPNIEGGIPPATAFVSLRYQPRSRFYIEGYSVMTGRQNRLSSLDLADRRTGGARSRTNIQNFFRRGACVRGLTTPGPTGCGSAGGILIPTGETLAQVQNRLLPIGATINGVRVVNNDTLVPTHPYLAGYGLVGVRGAWKFSETSELFVDFENIFDKSYRGISWGIDGAGRGVTVRYRYSF